MTLVESSIIINLLSKENKMYQNYYPFQTWNSYYPFSQHIMSWEGSQNENVGLLNSFSSSFSQYSNCQFNNSRCNQTQQSNILSQQNTSLNGLKIEEGQRKFLRNTYKIIPLKKKEKRVKIYKCGEQKQNRNVLSNIIRGFFRKINDIEKTETLVKNIIKKHYLSIQTQHFINFLKRLKIDHKKYLRYKKITHLFSNINNQKIHRDYCKIFRILLAHYKKQQFLLSTLTSRKLGKWSILLQLRGIKQLEEKLYYQ